MITHTKHTANKTSSTNKTTDKQTAYQRLWEMSVVFSTQALCGSVSSLQQGAAAAFMYPHLGMYSCGRPLMLLSLRALSTVRMYLSIRALISGVKGSKVRLRDPERLKRPSLLLSVQRSLSSGMLMFRKALIVFNWGTRSFWRFSKCTTSRWWANRNQARAWETHQVE